MQDACNIDKDKAACTIKYCTVEDNTSIVYIQMFLFRRKQTHAMVSSGDQHSCLWDKSGGLQQLFDGCFPKTLLILTTADSNNNTALLPFFCFQLLSPSSFLLATV